MDSANNSFTALRIAIAEDSQAVRRLLGEMVLRLGHTVVCDAADGEQLVDACRNCEVDIAIVDLDMPVVDGLTAAEELWMFKRIPVILVSGHSDLEHVMEENEPICGCLQKPIGIDDLEAAILKAIEKCT